MARLQQSYDALLDSVYGGLVLQTRLDKYVRILQSDHPADVLAALQAAYDRNPVNGASDAIDLLKYGRAALDKAGVPLAPTLQSMAQDLDSRGLLSTWLADNPGIHYTAPGQAAAIGKTGELNGLFILTGPTQKADPVQASAGQGSQGNVFFALHGNTTVDASKGTTSSSSAAMAQAGSLAAPEPTASRAAPETCGWMATSAQPAHLRVARATTP